MLKVFDPLRDIEGSRFILGPDGQWPNFHDAVLHHLKLWRGDMRPDDHVYVEPVIEAVLECASVKSPVIAAFKFHDCSDIQMSGFDHNSEINDLIFAFEERGFYADNITPLRPYIRVTFEKFPQHGVSLSFRCFRIEVMEKHGLERISVISR